MYTIYKVEAENDEVCYTDDELGIVNSFIHRGFDCDVYEAELEKPVAELTEEELEEVNWNFVESYHA